jgi:serine/threonine-protein kinase RIM15
VITYEFLYGIPPFHAPTPNEVFQNILAGVIDFQEEAEFDISAEAKDLMRQLMCKSIENRLGCRGGGSEEVKRHPFFSDVDWTALSTLEANFVPKPTNVEDTEYFDDRGAAKMKLIEDDIKQVIEQEKESANESLSSSRQSESGYLSGNSKEAFNANNASDNNTSDKKDDSADFGEFVYKNLPVLEKANNDLVQKLRSDLSAAEASRMRRRESQGSFIEENVRGSGNLYVPTASSPLTGGISLSRSNSISNSLNPTIHSNTGSTTNPSFLSSVSSEVRPRRVSESKSRLRTQSFNAGLRPSFLTSELIRNSIESDRQIINRHGIADDNSQMNGSNSLVSSNDSMGSKEALSSVDRSRATSIGCPNLNSTPITPSDSAQYLQNAKKQLLEQQQGRSIIGLTPSMSVNTSTNSFFSVAPSLQSSSSIGGVSENLFHSNINTGSSSSLQLLQGTATAQTKSIPHSPIGPFGSRPLEVLIADDNPLACKILETILTKLNCICVVVRNGAEVIRCALGDIKFE